MKNILNLIAIENGKITDMKSYRVSDDGKELDSIEPVFRGMVNKYRINKVEDDEMERIKFKGKWTDGVNTVYCRWSEIESLKS